MKHNTFILKCFSQFTCTDLDGSQKEGGDFLNLLQKEGGDFLNLLQKEGVPRKGGGWGGWFPQKSGGSNPRGNYE